MRIFLASYGGGHVAMLLPLIQALEGRGHQCHLLALTTAAPVAEREGLFFSRPVDYVDMNDSAIRYWGERLAETHHNPATGLSRDESVAYLGASFADLANIVGEEKAWNRYLRDGLNAFSPVSFMCSVLRRTAPDVVIATNAPRMEQAALRAAFQLNIPSLCLVDLFGLFEEPWLSRPDNGHVLAVSREDVKARMVAAGRRADDVHVTGNPMFDQLANPEWIASGRALRKDRAVGEHEKLVFWAEQPEPRNPELPRRIRAHLAETCRKRGWRLVVRLHPNTDPSQETIPEGVIQSYVHEPLPALIHACDVGVTMTSTVGWELLLCNKPLLVLPLSEFSDTVLYGDGDGALVVPSLDEAEQGLVLLLGSDPEARRLETLRKRLPKPGGSVERLCNLIEDVVAPRRFGQPM